jgi:glycerol-3-phosphate acyltransferase PlsX
LSESENKKIRIAVDAMGGDFAPDNVVKGALDAIKERGRYIHLQLVGKADLLRKKIKEFAVTDNDELEIVNADEVITMDDSPADSYRNKPNSSMSVGLELQKSGESDAFVSAGNTGSNLANSLFKLGRLEGISRPTIGSIIPTVKGVTLVLDVGASVDCKPKHLVEYAVMGSSYMNNIFNIEKPSVGLLGIGEEKSKGNELTTQTYELLEQSNMNFKGNVEGGDILKGKVDVVVCDGFTGNIVLKLSESFIDILKFKLKDYASRGFFKKLWIGAFSGTFKNILSDFDYQTYGGVPLLGVNGISFVGHGKSTPLAIKNMIFKSEIAARKNLPERIKENLKKFI